MADQEMKEAQTMEGSPAAQEWYHPPPSKNDLAGPMPSQSMGTEKDHRGTPSILNRVQPTTAENKRTAPLPADRNDSPHPSQAVSATMHSHQNPSLLSREPFPPPNVSSCPPPMPQAQPLPIMPGDWSTPGGWHTSTGVYASLLRREIQSHLKEQEKRETELRMLRTTSNGQQMTIRDQNQKISTLESHLEIARTKLVDQEKKLRQAQARMFKNMDGDTWTSGDDSTVRAEIEKMHARIKDWAKKYALDQMSDMATLKPEELVDFIPLLSQVTGVINEAATDKLEFFKKPRMDRKAPIICLQAIIAQRLYADIIGDPFFALNHNTDGSIKRIYDDLLNSTSPLPLPN